MRLGRVMAGVLVGVVAGALLGALPAAAHTEVEVEPAVGGAANAKITFNAEAEWDKAGISIVKVTLPAGIAPTDVTYASGPTGWTLAPDADGYAVTGPPLGTGRNAKHTVTVKQLPNEPTLVFKVLVTYTDGHVDRWIEAPSAANPKPDNPAPIATLQAPPGGFQAVPSPSPPAVRSASPLPNPTANDVIPPSVAQPTATDKNEDRSALPWIILAVLLVAAVAGGIGWYRRRATRR